MHDEPPGPPGPPDPDRPTERRKPGCGMLMEAARDFGIDLARSWMIGDRDADIAAGNAAGVRSILVLTGVVSGGVGGPKSFTT